MGKSTISMAIFNSYVKLPEGMPFHPILSHYPISGWNSAVTAVACGLAEAINRNDAALLAEATYLGANRLLRDVRCCGNGHGSKLISR
jgi:hypothetical protein